MKPIKLSDQHREAVNRRRRVILNYDMLAFMMPHLEGDELVDSIFATADLKNSPIDAVWMNWGEGNFALYESKIIEEFSADNYPRYPEWRKQGFDVIGRCHDAARKRGIESFWSYRINGSDTDGPKRDLPRFKAKHLQMCLYDELSQANLSAPLYDFAYPEVREHKLAIIGEALDLWDFDGIEIDFARACPVLPPGRAWTQREHMTIFMYNLRVMAQKKAAKRGHPILVSARVPETLAGCHFDGLDVRTWARRAYVDILTLGCRSFEVEYLAFQRMVRAYDVKLYPCMDDIHASEGYNSPPIEVFRGVVSNWCAQGFEGIQTFNFQSADPHLTTITRGLDRWIADQWTLHKRFYEEIGSGAIGTGKKTYVIQRRLGGRRDFRAGYPGDPIRFQPWAWATPRTRYCNSNIEAQLPTRLPADKDQDLFLHLYVGTVPEDSVLCVLLSRAESIKVRINNIPVKGRQISQWFVCEDIDDSELAQGDNLIGISLAETDPDVGFSQPEADPRVWVEKVELREVRELSKWEGME